LNRFALRQAKKIRILETVSRNPIEAPFTFSEKIVELDRPVGSERTTVQLRFRDLLEKKKNRVPPDGFFPVGGLRRGSVGPR